MPGTPIKDPGGTTLDRPALRLREPAPTANVVPAWVLPMLRAVRACGGDLGTAWAELPAHLPPDVAMPPIEAAAAVLLDLRLA